MPDDGVGEYDAGLLPIGAGDIKPFCIGILANILGLGAAGAGNVAEPVLE